MKTVYILRHATKDAHGNLTAEGIQQIQKIKQQLGKFTLVISSEMKRAKETAKLVTGQYPEIDKRANIIAIDEKAEEKLFHLGKTHKFGIAGVVFNTPEYRELVEKAGNDLVSLIKDTLSRLHNNEKALIIAHDGPMVAAERMLQHLSLDTIDKHFLPLEGYIVDEYLTINPILNS